MLHAIHVYQITLWVPAYTLSHAQCTSAFRHILPFNPNIKRPPFFVGYLCNA